MATTKKTEEMTTFLLETKNGQQRKVEVPSTWRVTFGPTVPFERKGGGGRYSDELWALRFYDGKELKAIFTDVRSFRDMSISIQEKMIKVQRQTFNKEGSKGGKAVVAEAKIETWVDPDNPDEDVTPSEFLKLDFQQDEDAEPF